jgi:hypothetical protein
MKKAVAQQHASTLVADLKGLGTKSSAALRSVGISSANN